jgi:hypothetical protein
MTRTDVVHPITIGEALRQLGRINELVQELDGQLLYADEQSAPAGHFADATKRIVGQLDDLDSYMSGALDGIEGRAVPTGSPEPA